ncbi:MAG: type II secretion system F family protein [bacterium]|nr:type II secretion system F family protein [bacterium]
MILFASVMIGIACAFVVLFLTSTEKPSLLKERFSKTTVKKENSFFKKLFLKIKEIVRPIAEKNVEGKDYVSKTKKMLLQAGYASSEEDVIRYDTNRISNTVCAVIVSFLLLMLMPTTEIFFSAILIVYMAYKYPEFSILRQIKYRQKEMVKYLPDAVDLLSICVQAGLGLDAAFAKVAEEFSLTSAVVSNEFSRLNNDILSGLNHEDAFKNLLLRNDSQDLQSFVALLIQSDRLGTSISQSLEAFCDSMRTKKRQRIEELSQQASTKMTIPMVLFMLPAIFLIIMYPALQKIMTNLH